MTIFERILTTTEVEQHVLDVLRKWSPTYIAEIERQTGRVAGSLPVPRAYSTATSFDKWNEDQLPAVLVISPGLLDPPHAVGSGRYRARYAVGVAAITSARSMDETAALAKLYTAALRAILIQRPSLEGFARGVTWLDENYDDLSFDDTRSLGAGQSIFAIEVDDVTSRNAGPLTPDDPPAQPEDPYADWPTATDVDVTVVPKTGDGPA